MKGIIFNPKANRYDTDWGWVKIDFQKNDVQVFGPTPDAWFNASKAVKTAGLYLQHKPDLEIGMAIVIAIQGQYAAWRGQKELEATLKSKTTNKPQTEE